jgi:hypothetical protein
MMVKNNSRRSQSGGPRISQQRPRTKTGTTALSSMVRVGSNLANVAVGGIKQRYGGRNGMSNLARDVGMLKMLVNAEEKQIFTLSTAQTVTSSSSLVYGIGTMAQGNASNQRVGDSVKISRIDLNLNFAYSTGTSTVANTQIFNWYLVRYLKTPSTSGTVAPNISEFLNQDGNSLYTPISFPNPDTIQNFQLMSNGQVEINLPNVATTVSTSNKVVNVSHPCNFHQEYSGSANTTITDNMCFLIFTAMNGINTGGLSAVTVSSAMFYIDN